MPTPRFDDVADVALLTDESVLERVRDLVQGAYRRQLWFMLLDEEQRQLPLLIPHDVPARPSRKHGDAVQALIALLVDEIRPGGMVVVLERPGDDRLRRGDLEWIEVIDEGCRAAGVVRRGPILAHDDGFRWIAAEDLLVGRE
jgi:hypothetical protein